MRVRRGAHVEQLIAVLGRERVLELCYGEAMPTTNASSESIFAERETCSLAHLEELLKEMFVMEDGDDVQAIARSLHAEVTG